MKLRGLLMYCLVVLCTNAGLIMRAEAQASDVPEAVASEAPTPEEEDPYANLPKSGILSSNQLSGAQSKAFDGPFGVEEPYDSTPPAIGGSMFRSSPSQWVAKVSNNTEDKFSVSLEAQQLDLRGKVLKRDYFSVSLQPGESKERVISARSDAANASLKIKNWKVTRTKKKESEETAEK
jgi:hypothetical protein